MTGRAIIAPLSFGDTTLPKIGINYVPPLAGALHDWAADNLDSGLIPSWASGTSAVTLLSDSGSPQVVTSGAGKAVRFNGTTDRMRVPFVQSGARTLVAVYRFTAIEASQMVLYGYNSYNGGAVLTDSASTFVTGRSGATTLRTVPDVVPNTNWHIVILSLTGAGSVFRHDNAEATATLPLADMDGLALGRSGGGDFLGPIEYRRVAVLAGGTTPAQRAAIASTLATQYGITL